MYLKLRLLLRTSIIHYHITIALSIKKWNCRKDRNQTNTSCLLQVVASRTPAGCEEEDSCRCEAVNGNNIVKSVQCSKTSSKVLAIPFVVRGPPKKLLKIDQNCTKFSLAQFCSKTAQFCSKTAQFCSKVLKICSKVLKICSKVLKICSKVLKIAHNTFSLFGGSRKFCSILLKFGHFW